MLACMHAILRSFELVTGYLVARKLVNGYLVARKLVTRLFFAMIVYHGMKKRHGVEEIIVV